HAIGVLIALFVVVFMVPTPFIRPPGPLQPAIGAALDASGLGWMAMAPAKLVSLMFAGLCLWLVYWRRQVLLGSVVLLVSTGLTALTIVLPMWLLPWDTTFALQAATLGRAARAPAEVLERIGL